MTVPAHAGGGEILGVENLVKHFPLPGRRGRVAAVNGVSLSVAPGETLGLVGETGSGKTTLGRCALLLEHATSGTVRFHGQDVVSPRPRDLRQFRSKVQMVFQDPSDALNPKWKNGKIVAEPLRWLGSGGGASIVNRVEQVIERVGLDRDVVDAYPADLSPGERQLLSIARAIAVNPELIVLDEVTSRLDVSARARVLELLLDLQRELGVAYLFISHDITAVLRISHRVAVMYLGKTVELGAAGVLERRPLHPYTMALMSSTLFPDPARKPGNFTLQGEIPSPIDLPVGCSLASRCPLAQDRARCEEPLLRQVESGRSVACHRAEEIRSGLMDDRTTGHAPEGGTSGLHAAG